MTLGHQFFSRPGGVLMRPHNRPISEEVLGYLTTLSVQACPEWPPDPTGFPAAEAVGHCLPVTKLPRQIAPGHARAGHIKDRLDDQAVAQCGKTPRFVFNRRKP